MAREWCSCGCSWKLPLPWYRGSGRWPAIICNLWSLASSGAPVLPILGNFLYDQPLMGSPLTLGGAPGQVLESRVSPGLFSLDTVASNTEANCVSSALAHSKA